MAKGLKTRVFTREELEEIGVPHECGGDEGTAEELHCEIYDTTRWSNVYEFVFRAPDDGKTYLVYYDVPATERQEGGIDLWDYENRIKAVEVEERVIQTTKWVGIPEDGE